MTVPWRLTMRRRPGQGGQVLVIFALALIALMGAAGLAFDVGRFYTEKRFLQNAADAGALAVANALIRGATSSEAEAEGRDVIARNLLGSPTGSTGTVAAPPVYEAGHAGDPAHLVSGILISGTDVRVAIQSQVSYTFGRALGFDTNLVGGRARAKANADLLPIAVRHYINAAGPYDPTYPCTADRTTFRDLIATAETSCLGTTSNGELTRTAPTPGLAFDSANPDNDPSHHGPIISLVGQGASPSNAASFRGAVVLDIRNFSSTSSNVFYNGVTAATLPNTLKGLEAGWVLTGYPGPGFPPATTPPDPNDQVGILDGNSTGEIVDAMRVRYSPGDEIIAGVYSGVVQKIPDFQLLAPATVAIEPIANRDGQVTIAITKNSDFLGQAYTTVFANWQALADRVDPSDAVDPDHPMTTGTLLPIVVNPSPATPPTTVSWSTFETVDAPAGVYTVWVRGHSPSPYLTDHYYPVGIAIGAQRDFWTPSAGLILSTPATGTTATGSITVSTSNKTLAYFGGTVTATIEGGPDSLGTLPAGIGSLSVTPSSFALNRGDDQPVSVSINPGTLGPGIYHLSLRLEGTNLDGQPVSRMVPITLSVATAGSANEYVDILGFAVFRITSVPAGSGSPNNAILGYAISGVYADMNDPALRRGQVARLAPWN